MDHCATLKKEDNNFEYLKRLIVEEINYFHRELLTLIEEAEHLTPFESNDIRETIKGLIDEALISIEERIRMGQIKFGDHNAGCNEVYMYVVETIKEPIIHVVSATIFVPYDMVQTKPWDAILAAFYNDSNIRQRHWENFWTHIKNINFVQGNVAFCPQEMRYISAKLDKFWNDKQKRLSQEIKFANIERHKIFEIKFNCFIHASYVELIQVFLFVGT